MSAKEAPGRGGETATRLLDAAESLFARRGYRGASLREIAARAGIAQPGLYNHFKSKEALYRAVLARSLGPLAAHMEALLTQPLGAEEMLGLAGQLTDLLAAHPEVAGLVVRAMQGDGVDGSPEQQIALDWLEKLMEIGRRINAAAGLPYGAEELVLYQLASFNMACGYFWSAPLVARLTGKEVRDGELLARQKRLLGKVERALRQEGRRD